MTRSMIWLFILQIALISFAVCELSTHEEIRSLKAHFFFDYDLCDDEDALNWACFIPRGCADEQPPLELRKTIDGQYEAPNCNVVLAIQKYSTENSYTFWRVVMQVQNVNDESRNVSNVDMDEPLVKFIHGMKPVVACSVSGSSVIVQKLKYTPFRVTDAQGLYDKNHNMFMCEFIINFGTRFGGNNIHTGKTGIEWRKKSNSMETVKSLGESLVMNAAVDDKYKCDMKKLVRKLNLIESIIELIKRKYEPELIDVEYPVMDRVKVTCRPNANASLQLEFQEDQKFEYFLCQNNKWFGKNINDYEATIKKDPYYVYCVIFNNRI